MAQMMVRNIDDGDIDLLLLRARSEGVSTEEMARRAIKALVRPRYADLAAAIDTIRIDPPPGFDTLTELRHQRDGDDDADR